ncbi:MAG: hypothetical protein ABIU77_19765 [Ferruginibacter sp.]
MKKLLLISFLFSATTTIAQTDSLTLKKSKTSSIAIVQLMDGRTIKGWFYQMDSDHVYLLNSGIKNPNHMNINSVNAYIERIPIDALQINTIALKKKNGGLRGALIGLGIGALTGAIIGYASGDDPATDFFSFTAGEKAALGASFFGVTGALTGAIIGGLLKTKFIIGGKKEIYRDLHGELMQRLVLQ